MEAQRQQSSAVPVGEESEAADADEARWQQVEQEAAQEFVDGQSHESLLVAVSRVSPSEGDVALGESHQPAVGDGDAMSIGAEIAQDVFGTAEGWLGVDDPVVVEQPAQPCVEGSRLGERQEVSEELEFPSMERVAKSSDELAAEYMAEYADGQKKGVSRGDPSGVIRSEAAGGNDAMDMGMMTPTPTIP
jgi:hypothetical protein